ncbi:MAG TPA: epoxide hydrolase [Micromonosporaceae bacterium]|jgi:pimeloyl-ACP methyl ester carboxylesterase
MPVTTDSSAGATGIRPFAIEISEADLEELRTRITATRWPEKETVADASQGVQSATIQELARYWASDYDWRNVEAKLNALPQFMTEIDGLDIHFIHVRSKHDDALPLIITHGWPGSIIEMLDVVGPLSDPTAYGGSAKDAFHLVIPSMPGYGFSAKPTSTGWGPEHMARAWAELMTRLGYTRYVAQGGDWGAVVTELMGAQAPKGLIGIHTNMPGALPPKISKVITSNVLGAGDPAPTDLSEEEQRAYDRLSFFYTKGIGYALEMGNRPQTLYGLADSPIALAAWMLDHDAWSLEDISRAFVQEQPVGNLTRDEVLDNVTLYWLTNTGVSASRLYWENKLGFFDVKGVSVPTAVSVFPNELYQASRVWAEQAYPNLIYFNEVDKGNHFAAWQEPELFATEVRAGFQPLR